MRPPPRSWTRQADRVDGVPTPLVLHVLERGAERTGFPGADGRTPIGTSRRPAFRKLLLRPAAVRREDLPLRFRSRQVHVQIRAGTALSAHGIPVLAGHDV